MWRLPTLTSRPSARSVSGAFAGTRIGNPPPSVRDCPDSPSTPPAPAVSSRIARPAMPRSRLAFGEENPYPQRCRHTLDMTQDQIANLAVCSWSLQPTDPDHLVQQL